MIPWGGTSLSSTLNSKANDSNVVHKIGNETIAGVKKFTSSIQVERADPYYTLQSVGYIKGTAPSNDIYQGVRFYDDPNSGSENRITAGFEVSYCADGYNRSFIHCRNYANGNTQLHYQVSLRVPNDNERSIDFVPSANNKINLGTSDHKWKDVYATTFHGDVDFPITEAEVN